MTVEATLNGFIRRDLVSDGPVLIRINSPADGAPMPGGGSDTLPTIDVTRSSSALVRARATSS